MHNTYILRRLSTVLVSFNRNTSDTAMKVFQEMILLLLPLLVIGGRILEVTQKSLFPISSLHSMFDFWCWGSFSLMFIQAERAKRARLGYQK